MLALAVLDLHTLEEDSYIILDVRAVEEKLLVGEVSVCGHLLCLAFFVDLENVCDDVAVRVLTPSVLDVGVEHSIFLSFLVKNAKLCPEYLVEVINRIYLELLTQSTEEYFCHFSQLRKLVQFLKLLLELMEVFDWVHLVICVKVLWDKLVVPV